MTCQEAIERISAALDGELSGRERRELDAHLDQCPACAALFNELAEHSRLLRELDCEVPDELSAHIIARLPRWRATPRLWHCLGAAAACLCLTLCMAAALRGAVGWSAQRARGAGSDSEISAQAEDSPVPELSAFGDETKAASPKTAGAQFLRGVGSGALSGQYIGSAAELDALLAAYGQNCLAAGLGYDGDFFSRSALLVISCQSSGADVQPAVREVRTVTGGYRVSLDEVVQDGSSPAQNAWIILIETQAAEAGSVPSVTVTADY